MKRILFYGPGPTYFRHAMSISRATGVPPLSTTVIDELRSSQAITGNRGNAVHAEAPPKLFRRSDTGSALVSLPHLLRDVGRDEYRRIISTYFDHIVVSFANFIRPKQDHQSILDSLRALPEQIPLCVLGAGIQDQVLPQSLSFSTLELCRFLGERASIFGVRGADTQNWLFDQGIKNTCAIGCPSMYLFPQSISRLRFDEIPSEPYLITAGHLSRTKLTIERTARGRLFAKFFSGVDFADYVFQDEPFSFEDLTRRVGFYNEGTGEFIAGPINEYLSRLSGCSIRFPRYYYFLDVSGWRQMCRRYNLYMGDRFHAGVAALQASVPSLILRYDRRVSELTDHFGIPAVSLEEAREMTIPEIIRDKMTSGNLDRFKATYKTRLSEFCAEMEKGGLDVVSKDVLSLRNF